jgi:hypothetical protein
MSRKFRDKLRIVTGHPDPSDTVLMMLERSPLNGLSLPDANTKTVSAVREADLTSPFDGTACWSPVWTFI